MNIRVGDDIGIIIQMPSRIKRIGIGENTDNKHEQNPKQPTRLHCERYYVTAWIFVFLSLKGIYNDERIKQITEQKRKDSPLFVRWCNKKSKIDKYSKI